MRLSILVALLLLFGFAASSSQAQQATRTWVSGVGDDANPCARTAPCKTFAGAISKTASGGEINCLDPGGFGALTITKPVSILCDSVSNGGVLVAGTNGINVNMPAQGNKTVLSGLDFEGVSQNATAGLNGVSMIGAGVLTIRNCTIRNFSTSGVNVQGTAQARVVVQNCYITNSGTGVSVAGASGAVNNAEVVGSLLDSNNTNISVGPGGALVLASSVLTGANTAIATSGDGQVISYSNNVIRNPGRPTSTLPLQ